MIDAYADAPVERIARAIAQANEAEADRVRYGSRLAAVWKSDGGFEEVH